MIGGPHTQTDFFFLEFGDLSLTCLFKIRAKYLEKTILFVKETASVERHSRQNRKLVGKLLSSKLLLT